MTSLIEDIGRVAKKSVKAGAVTALTECMRWHATRAEYWRLMVDQIRDELQRVKRRKNGNLSVKRRKNGNVIPVALQDGLTAATARAEEHEAAIKQISYMVDQI